MMESENMDRLREQLKRQERFADIPYRDNQGWANGYGHWRKNLADLPSSITEPEACVILEQDIKNAIRECAANIKGFELIVPIRQAVLINMCFNMGIGRRATATTKGSGLLGFKYMIRAVELGDHRWVAREMIKSKWAEKLPRRVLELLFQELTGEWL
jgi:lysozyme